MSDFKCDIHDKWLPCDECDRRRKPVAPRSEPVKEMCAHLVTTEQGICIHCHEQVHRPLVPPSAPTETPVTAGSDEKLIDFYEFKCAKGHAFVDIVPAGGMSYYTYARTADIEPDKPHSRCPQCSAIIYLLNVRRGVTQEIPPQPSSDRETARRANDDDVRW